MEFFAGCGGTSVGFKRASNDHITYRVVAGVELDPSAARTFERNVGAPILVSDIRDLTDPVAFSKFAEQIDGPGPLLVIGCAPCQGFSSHRKKDKREDPRNSLLATFAQVVVQLDPTVVVMENVPEMLSEAHYPFFMQWKERLMEHGYTIKIDIHNLAEFGVPQERFRALAIAAKWEQFDMPNGILHHSQFRTVRETISSLPKLEAGGVDPVDPMHITSKHRASTVELIRQIPHDGGSRRSLPTGVGLNCHTKVDGFRDVYGRLWWDRPSVAITSRCRTPSCGRFTHPNQDRGLSVREAALLQGFPSDYFFEGTFDDKYKQIGNAVSPIFAQAIAEHLASEWVKDHSQAREELLSKYQFPLKKSFSSSIAHIKKKRIAV
ncbi:DNA cytosine methyltransferase [Rhodococcus sp. IEGM 1381]|uniref:DNA cytosine methyltransferase n=1 Tax=Rhodococcus sp. IEGM 1381 TaxID=3047085 RepID=UPI0024B7D50E|nr:DNA cytosine methyltransferase [Rhodococcus sp. IEGM 1381]MDI9896002.1 DNA cytosine methyltransferase [Rhodococcus sp. IEGM 1381]